MHIGDMKPIHIPDSDEELLADCDVFTFRSSGKGGQHVNKTESGVRIVHRPSGLTAICRRERSQYLNRKRCLLTLRARLEKLNRKEPPRIPTAIPVSVKRKRRESKSITGIKKQLRKKPEPE